MAVPAPRSLGTGARGPCARRPLTASPSWVCSAAAVAPSARQAAETEPSATGHAAGHFPGPRCPGVPAPTLTLRPSPGPGQGQPWVSLPSPAGRPQDRCYPPLPAPQRGSQGSRAPSTSSRTRSPRPGGNSGVDALRATASQTTPTASLLPNYQTHTRRSQQVLSAASHLESPSRDNHKFECVVLAQDFLVA